MSNNRIMDLPRIGAMLKALGNPQRLRIFLKLAECGGPTGCDATAEAIRRCAGDLGAELDIGASTVSHHLKELRHAGLMEVERRGQRIECWINEEAVRLLADFFAGPVSGRGGPRRSGRRSRRGRRTSAAAE